MKSHANYVTFRNTFPPDYLLVRRSAHSLVTLVTKLLIEIADFYRLVRNQVKELFICCIKIVKHLIFLSYCLLFSVHEYLINDRGVKQIKMK